MRVLVDSHGCLIGMYRHGCDALVTRHCGLDPQSRGEVVGRTVCALPLFVCENKTLEDFVA